MWGNQIVLVMAGLLAAHLSAAHPSSTMHQHTSPTDSIPNKARATTVTLLLIVL